MEVIGPLSPGRYARFRVLAVIALGLFAIAVVIAFVSPILGDKRKAGSANPGKVLASYEETFDEGTLPLHFERVSGAADVRGGRLWVSEGLVLFGYATASDWFELSLRLESDGDRIPEEIRIGMHVDRSAPSVRGTFVRLLSRAGEGMVRSGDRVLARFPMPPWDETNRDIGLVKRASSLELRIHGRLAVEVMLPRDLIEANGPFSFQIIGGSTGLDRVGLVVREGLE